MKTIPNNFGVKITSADFASSDYGNINDCSLAKAIKRKFPNHSVNCGASTVNIGDIEFDIVDVNNQICIRTQSNLPVKGFNVRLNKSEFQWN